CAPSSLMRAAICSSEISTAAIFGLLHSEANWADEVANLFLLLMQVLVEQEVACLPRGATYYASSSFRSMTNTVSLRNLCALRVSAVNVFFYCRDAEGAEISQRWLRMF